MYYLEHIKGRVLTEFSKTDSSICVIVTTCALGLGVDIMNITSIYHFGLPGDIEAIDQNLYLLYIFLIVSWLDGRTNIWKIMPWTELYVVVRYFFNHLIKTQCQVQVFAAMFAQLQMNTYLLTLRWQMYPHLLTTVERFRGQRLTRGIIVGS